MVSPFSFYRDGRSGADFSKDVAAAVEVDARVNGERDVAHARVDPAVGGFGRVGKCADGESGVVD